MQSLCTLRDHCRQWPRNTRYQADATPYLGRTFTGWIAPACGWRTYSITSSARASSVGGTSRPSALAVLRLITSSNLVGCLHRQVGRLLALEDTVDVAGGATELVDIVSPVGDQAADDDEGALEVDRGQLVLGRQPDDQGAMTNRRSARRHDQPAVGRAREGRDGAVNLGRLARADRVHLHPERWRPCLMMANWLVPEPWVGIPKHRHERVKPGAMSLSRSSHFPPTVYSVVINPVALPPK